MNPARRGPLLTLLALVLLTVGAAPSEQVAAAGSAHPPALQLAGQPLSTQFYQAFGVGNGAPAQCSNHGVAYACDFGSNRNYFFNANGTNLVNATTTMSLTGPLSGASAGGGNWSYQMNMYSPASSTLASYLQCVMSDYGPASGDQVSVQDYWVGANDHVPIVAYGPTYVSIPPSDFSSGLTVKIEAVTNSTQHVVGCQYAVTAADGRSLMNQYVPLSIGTLSPGDPEGSTWWTYSVPIVGFETQLIGAYSGETAAFTQASGTFTYTAVNPIGWTSTDPDTFSWESYKGTGTIERSNIGYFPPALLPVRSSSTSTAQTTIVISTVTTTMDAGSSTSSNGRPSTVTETSTTTVTAGMSASSSAESTKSGTGPITTISSASSAAGDTVMGTSPIPSSEALLVLTVVGICVLIASLGLERGPDGSSAPKREERTAAPES